MESDCTKKQLISELSEERNDLSGALKTKERMLDDQLNYINELKGIIQTKEDEVQHAIESKNKYRDIYDDSVAQEIQETER